MDRNEKKKKITDKICANRMKNTPTRTFVASGCSIGSGLGRSSERMVMCVRVLSMFKAFSLTVSLIREPLRPTKETPKKPD